MSTAPGASSSSSASPATSTTTPGAPRRPVVSLLDYGAGNVRSVR